MKTYLELIKLPTFEERFEYLRCYGSPSKVTFGEYRLLNQMLYRSPVWKRIRQQVILRDDGCDLAMPDRPIGADTDPSHRKYERIIIHHINPITVDDIVSRSEFALNPEYLICVSELTHKAIHYSNIDLLPKPFIPRRPNDTCPWKR